MKQDKIQHNFKLIKSVNNIFNKHNKVSIQSYVSNSTMTSLANVSPEDDVTTGLQSPVVLDNAVTCCVGGAIYRQKSKTAVK